MAATATKTTTEELVAPENLTSAITSTLPRNSSEAKAAGLPVFKFFSDQALKAVAGDESDEGEGPYVVLTASSNATDLVGQFFTESALKQMALAAPGTLFFLNHSYNIPEDVFGTVVSTELVQRELPDPLTGQLGTFLCLDYKVAVETANPRAMQTYQYIKSGKAKLGASISVLIGNITPLKDGREAIDSIYYLECSIVGIPCNQQSWVQYASKALAQLAASVAGAAPTSKKELLKSMNENETNTTVAATPAQEATNAATVATKSLWEQAIAEAEMPETVYDAFWALMDVLGDLVEAAEDGELTDPLAALNDVLTGFSATVIAIALPAMQPITDATVDAAGAAAAGASAGETDESMKQSAAVLSLRPDTRLIKALSATTMKTATRKSKADATLVQCIHDVSKHLGAGCAESKDANSDEEMTEENKQLLTKAASFEKELGSEKQLKEQAQSQVETLKKELTSFKDEVTKTQAELAKARQEKDEWEAAAIGTKALVQAYLREPMPRPTAIATSNK